jgi:FHA domain
MMDGTELGMAVASRSLLVVSGRARGTVIPVPTGELLLGRETSWAGLLGDDSLLSRRHARITHDGQGRMILEDLGSTNGTLLNGARVTGPQQLRTSDVIEVGGSRLQVVDATPAGDAAAGVARPGLAEDEPLSAAWTVEPVEPVDDLPVTAAPVLPPPRDHAQDVGGAGAQGRRGDRARPARRRGRATVQGQVRGIQQRTEGVVDRSSTVWTFRVERYDGHGNRLAPIPVLMRGAGFEGALSEGDEVSVAGVWKHGTLHTERIENLTSGATVKTRSFKTLILVCAVLFALMAAGTVAAGLYLARDAGQAQQEWCQSGEQEGFDLPGC